MILAPNKILGQTWEQKHLDTLIPKLATMKDDTNKASLISDISYFYFTIDPNKGILQGENAWKLSDKLKWDKGESKAYSSIGANYWAQNDFIHAQSYFIKALKISENINDKKGTERNLHNLATLYASLHNYPEALIFYEKALRINQELCDTPLVYGCLVNIGGVYENQGNYPEALNYCTRSLELAQKWGSRGDKGDVTFRLGIIGTIYAQQGDYKKAIEYENHSLELTKQIGINNDIAKKLEDIADVYLLMKKYTLALIYYLKALNLFKTVNTDGSKTYQGKVLGNLGKAYILMTTNKNTVYDDKKNNLSDLNKNYIIKKAIKYFNDAIILLKQTNDLETLQEIYYNLSNAQSQIKHNTEALASYKSHVLYKDSAFSLERDKEIMKNQLEYEFGRQKDSLSYQNELQRKELQNAVQQKELTRLRTKQILLEALICVAFLTIISFHLVSKSRLQKIKLQGELVMQKQEKEFKEVEYQRQLNDITFSALRSQMNPHFMFNALNTIQSYVYNNDKKAANIYLGKFSELMRKILDNSRRSTITLEEEIELLKLYLDIEKARFGDTFIATINVASHLSCESIYIPPMLIQPYAENSVKHGLFHINGPKKMEIIMNESEDSQNLIVTVSDNGIGRKKSSEINKMRHRHNSFGNTATEKRIELINRLFEKETTIKIFDKENSDGSSAGTMVVITVPIIRNQIA
jgi:two-component system, LytTR family, sensor kinase